jgi:hypothetical protein
MFIYVYPPVKQAQVSETSKLLLNDTVFRRIVVEFYIPMETYVAH